MKIPKYWALGESSVALDRSSAFADRFDDPVECWGWSDISEDDARRNGSERADNLANKINQGTMPDHYGYHDKPVREEILEEWKDDSGGLFAMVTRNSYGCKVLNTKNVMFVDIDFPEDALRPAGTSFFGSLFGKKKETVDPRAALEDEAIDKLNQLAALDAKFGARVYRTYAGLRYLFTHGLSDPTSEHTQRAMKMLGSDELYIRLCKNQECFRARLTPKPWRCGHVPAHSPFPYQNEASKKYLDKWLQQYEKKSSAYKTCGYISHIGNRDADPEIQRVIHFHDQQTNVESELQLA